MYAYVLLGTYINSLTNETPSTMGMRMEQDIPPKFLAHVYTNPGPMPISLIILFFRRRFLNRINLWLLVFKIILFLMFIIIT